MVAPSTTVQSRVASIDIFRGLTILVMIFVNDVAGVKDLPWWTYHLPGNVNGMTYVDMVFPFFLFIVGISLPLSVRHRLSKDSSMARLWGHILARSFALVVLGIALANGEKADAHLTGMSGNIWLLLTLLGAILFWNIYPRSDKHKTLFKAMKLAGLVLMAAMFAIFRRVGKDGHTAWLDFGYWEILGLIGWTYLAVSILYIPTRRWRWSPLAWLVCLVTLNAASLAHWITFSAKLPYYFWPWNTGCFCLLTMAGIVTSTIFLSDTLAATPKQKALWAIRLFRCSLPGRLAANAARHLQNTRHSHLGSLLRGRRDSRVPCVVLDLRRAQACPLGRHRQTSRIQHASHLPAARPLLRDAW